MEVVDRKNKLKEIAEKVLADLQLELVELDLFQAGRKSILRVYIYKEGGVSVDDCTRASRELGVVLDLEDILPDRYNLEVSSPGVDRPLKTIRDFERNLGRMIRVVPEEPIEGKKALRARLLKIEENTLIFEEGKETIPINIENVLNAKVQIEF